MGLAQAFLHQDKNSQALVVVEDLLCQPNIPAQVYILHAHLLLRAGEVEQAVRQYRTALDIDPTTCDTHLAERLGIGPGFDQGEIVEGRVRSAGEDSSDSVPEVMERPRISFADVGGMEEVKDEIRMKIIHPLTHPELYRAYGKTVGGGILMYGPPGCGKTHLARATAGEVEAGFLAVGINDVLEMWIGQSERNLHEVFERRPGTYALCSFLR